ncbi:hypothetical protein C8Q76DRAFT_797237 [Earliella scabrosa]|nr:hypothetical protein C8Q76DRAFT_797237 [Earliella scabrosa]
MHKDLLWSVAGLRPVYVLLPKLTALRWVNIGIEDECLPVILSFCGPHLRDLHLPCWTLVRDPRRILQTSLSIAAERFTDLTTIYISIALNVQVEEHGVSPMQTLPAKLLNLTRFHCRDVHIERNVFSTLANLGKLRDLAIALPQDLDWFCATLPSRGFTELRSLELVTSLRSYIAFSTIISFQHVRELNLLLSGTLEGRDLALLASSICKQFAPAALVDLCVRTSAWFNRAAPSEIYPPTVLRSSHLRPLLQYPELRIFIFVIDANYSLDNELFVDMSRAWPKLQSLNCVATRCTYSRRPTIDILSTFTAHCSNLQSLHIAIDARRELTPKDVTFAVPPKAASRSALCALNVDNSPVSHPECVAAFIARLFPRLVHLYFGVMEDNGDEQAWRMGWVEVQRYLPWFQTMRAAVERDRSGEEDQ